MSAAITTPDATLSSNIASAQTSVANLEQGGLGVISAEVSFGTKAWSILTDGTLGCYTCGLGTAGRLCYQSMSYEDGVTADCLLVFVYHFVWTESSNLSCKYDGGLNWNKN